MYRPPFAAAGHGAKPWRYYCVEIIKVNDIIAGNVCSLCAMVTDSVSGTRKKREQILGIQILSQVFYAAGSIILKGYSSTAQNAVAVLRNLAAMKRIKYKAVEWALVVLGVALGTVFNNRGLVGWLPIVANLEYSIAVFKFRESAKGLKAAFLINAVMYFAFNLIILNYVGAAANVIVIVTTGISLAKKASSKKGPSEDSPAENGSAAVPASQDPPTEEGPVAEDASAAEGKSGSG